LAFTVSLINYVQFALKYLSQKIAVTTCGFQEPRIYTFGFVLHQVKHGFYFPFVGKNLTVIRYSLF
jgi:hypothetical protein